MENMCKTQLLIQLTPPFFRYMVYATIKYRRAKLSKQGGDSSVNNKCKEAAVSILQIKY